MALNHDLTGDDELVFYDTDVQLRYTIYSGNPTASAIAAGDAVPQDITGWAIGWFLRKKPGATDPPLIEKTTTGGVSIVGDYDADPEVNTQRVEVSIADTDTYDPDVDPPVNIKAGSYYYALKRLDPGNETILAYGKLALVQTAAWNA